MSSTGSGRLKTVLLASVAVWPMSVADAQEAKSDDVTGQSILLESIGVPGTASANPPSFEEQHERFLHRPGAESAVSITQQDAGPQGNMRDVLQTVPGVYAPDRGAGSSGMISMRGSDIGQSGSRGGRGVRGYLDGIPLGRTESGLTNALIDMRAADYVEVYRGANSLRYGSIATGGALNFVSKTGLSAPGGSVSASGGSFGNKQSFAEYGGSHEDLDWYVQGSKFYNDGFQTHTREDNQRFGGNFAWRPTADIESRTFVGLGEARNQLGGSVALNQLDAERKSASAQSLSHNARADFDYQRIANRTTIRGENSSYEVGGYFLNTALDHLPVPVAGIVDNAWRDVGLSLRNEYKTSIAELPTELVGGIRVNYESGDFKRWRHSGGGQYKTQNVADFDMSSWLGEAYGETAVEVLPRVKTFFGLQGVFTNRDLEDNYSGPETIATIGGGANPQPGRSAGRQEYSRAFHALNPKLGANWEYASRHFLFGNVARSYEVPGGGDLSNILSAQASNGVKLAELEAQSAWTAEMGFRGGDRRFEYDVTFYHMRLKNEILTRCATEIVGSNCGTTQIAFNADKTIHNGIELGGKVVPFVDLLTGGDEVYVSGVWNFTDFKFDGDATFGDRRLPVIPVHQIYIEPGYRLGNGFYVSGNARYQSERQTTFNSGGGDAFVVQPHTLYGAKVGWNSPDNWWGLWLEARNLTDVAYVADVSATPTATGTSPSVTPGDGRAIYAGLVARW